MNQLSGKLYVVATPIGNLEDLSYRANTTLKAVSWIAAEDTRHSQHLLAHMGIQTSLISYHEHNEKERTAQLIQKLMQGESGALISDAGTPLISDPGYLLVAAAQAAGISVVPVPGPCAAIAALSVAGLPTDKFLFEGFLPAKSSARLKRLTELKHFPHTMIFYEAPHRLISVIEQCGEIFSWQRRVTLAREITKKFESFYVADLQKIADDLKSNQIPLKGEFIFIVAGHSSEDLNETETENEMHRVLSILLAELPLKQAVQIAMKLTGLPKNALYKMATQIKT